MLRIRADTALVHDLALVAALIAIPFLASVVSGPGGFSPAQVKRQRMGVLILIGGLYGSCVLATLADPANRSMHLFLMFFPASPVPLLAVVNGLMRWPNRPAHTVAVAERTPKPVAV